MWRPRLSLATKLILGLVGSMVVLLGFVGYLSMKLHRNQLEEMTFLSADRISDVIRRSMRHAMLLNHREEVFHTIATIGRQPGIRKIRIFDKEGRINYSTDPEEVGRLVDKQAEACYTCHAQKKPLARLSRPDRRRVYAAEDGTRIVGLIQPIENERDCSRAACHAHSETARILGVLDTNLSLAHVDAGLAEHQRETMLFILLSILVVGVISAVFVEVMVRRPVRRLISGTEHIGRGDLDYRLPEGAPDEMGRLAHSFNRMTGELKKAQEEIKQWTHTLETRVEKKSEEIRRTQEHLMRIDRMAALGKLAAVVAHEINNPLSGILTYAKLLSRRLKRKSGTGEDSSELRKSLKLIEKESLRCGNIVRNLLNFARQNPLRAEKQDINALVERCLFLVHHHLDLQNISVEKRLAANLPLVLCDAAQIEQSVLALVMNAAEAMPRGGRLTLQTEYQPKPSAIKISIADEGPGIPEEIRSNIFEPFFTTKERAQGVGLGLTIAASIIERHGGNIQLESQLQQGSVFMIVLPAKPSLDDTSEGVSA